MKWLSGNRIIFHCAQKVGRPGHHATLPQSLSPFLKVDISEYKSNEHYKLCDKLYDKPLANFNTIKNRFTQIERFVTFAKSLFSGQHSKTSSIRRRLLIYIDKQN